jgi:hypothetical protein
MGWTAVVVFQAGARDVSLFQSVWTVSGAHPASHLIDTRGPFSGGMKLPGLEADHSPPSSAEVKNGGAIPPLHYMSEDNFTFFLTFTYHHE